MKLLDKFMDQLKNSWLFFVFALVALILWNTNILFESLSLQERQKMGSGEWLKKSILKILALAI